MLFKNLAYKVKVELLFGRKSVMLSLSKLTIKFKRLFYRNKVLAGKLYFSDRMAGRPDGVQWGKWYSSQLELEAGAWAEFVKMSQNIFLVYIIRLKRQVLCLISRNLLMNYWKLFPQTTWVSIAVDLQFT